MRKIIAGSIVRENENIFWQVGLLFFKLDDASVDFSSTRNNLSRYGEKSYKKHKYTKSDLLIYSCSQNSLVSVFDRKIREHHKEIVLPKNARMYCDNWYLVTKQVKVNKYFNTDVDTLKFLASTKEFEFDGYVEPVVGYGSEKNILLKVRKWKNEYIGLFDLEELTFTWTIDSDGSLIEFVTPDVFYLGRGTTDLRSVKSGDKIRSLEITGDPAIPVKHCLVKYNIDDRILYSHNVMTGVSGSIDFKDHLNESEEYDVNVCGDEVFLYLYEQDKLSLYSLSSSELCSSWYLPRRLFGDDNLRTLEVFRIGENLAVNVTHRGSYQSAECHSIYVFKECELSEFRSTHVAPEVFDEIMACRFERVAKKDDLFDFKVTFPEPELFSTVYRHLSEQGDCIVEEFGWLSLYRNPTMDKKWSGHIVYDLSNQSFNEQERHELYLLARCQVEVFFSLHKAGYDRDVAITIDVVLDDKVVEARVIVVKSTQTATASVAKQKPLKVTSISRSSLYKHRQQLRKLGWLESEVSLPRSEVKLWLALAQHKEVYFWIIDGYKHENESYYGSLLKWINACCEKKLGITRIESRREMDGEDEYTVVAYVKKQKKMEQRYLNEPHQISESYLDELARFAGKKGLRLVLNDNIGMLGCIPGEIELG